MPVVIRWPVCVSVCVQNARMNTHMNEHTHPHKFLPKNGKNDSKTQMATANDQELNDSRSIRKNPNR